jgi:hypothetical protein
MATHERPSATGAAFPPIPAIVSMSASAYNYFVAGIQKGRSRQARTMGCQRSPSCPSSPSERRGGRRFVCRHHFPLPKQKFLDTVLKWAYSENSWKIRDSKRYAIASNRTSRSSQFI